MAAVSSTTMLRRRHLAENYLVIWIGENIDTTNKDYHNTLAQLQIVLNDVYTFTDRDECIDFLTDIDETQVILIVEVTIAKEMVSLIHDIPHLYSIYVLCESEVLHKDWSNNYNKIKGMCTTIPSICKALKATNKQYNQSDISISYVNINEDGSSQTLDQLEPAFMYTQLFKEILLQMDYGEKDIHDFTHFWRDEYVGNILKLNDITKFEHEYRSETTIWWYTREYFIYQMLNRSLRTLEVETIMKMAFFLSALHQQIENLHKKNVNFYNGSIFEIYRGQGLSLSNFEKLSKNEGGLISFNNFLSTSTSRDVSLIYAYDAAEMSGMVGILFQMTIDPRVSTIPFASIEEVSYFNTENEILFSMHTVFRIGNIRPLDTKSPLYQVDLKLTSDDDQQLRLLTDSIRNETRDSTGWERLGELLLRIGQFNKAEELYSALLEHAPNDNNRAHIYQKLALVTRNQGRYKKAISFYDESLEIYRKTLPETDLVIGASYNNIALVYNAMADYWTALQFFEKSHEILENALPPNHLNYGGSYNNLGLAYYNMGDYSKALQFYRRAQDIREKALPTNHPDMAITYNNIGQAHHHMCNYTGALEFYTKALKIRERVLPPNHPDFAVSYENIGLMYRYIGDYSKALDFHNKALEIRKKALRPYHTGSASSYSNIGVLYHDMGDYTKALEVYSKALEIEQTAGRWNDPNLATLYNHIGQLYRDMGDYSKALEVLNPSFVSWGPSGPTLQFFV